MSEVPVPGGLSRRAVLGGGSALLLSLGAVALGGATSAAASPLAPFAGKGAGAKSELARFRPVTVSSLDYGPVTGSFVVDDLDAVGVRGSGWRAERGDPQWIAVDLEAVCTVEEIVLAFEATVDDPEFVVIDPGAPRRNTTGEEILSSCAVAFVLETSTDGKRWTVVHREMNGRGGLVRVPLAKPAQARWVRMTVTRRSNGNPLGLNGLEVYGSAKGHRPDADGWTDFAAVDRPKKTPKLHTADDGTVALDSGWFLTYDDKVPGLDTDEWLPATVPGTVLASLVEQDRLPDPAYGYGNLRIPDALSRHSWWYHRTFTTPDDLAIGGDRIVWLEFEGVNHHAEIHLDGVRVAEQTNPFSRGAYDVTALLRARREHALAVRIDPIPIPGSPADKGPEGIAWVDAGAESMNRNSPTYLAASGWDWMPAVRDRAAGIWNHVRLRSTGAVVIGDLRIDTTLPDLPKRSRAAVSVLVPLRNATKRDQSVALTVTLAGKKVRRTTTVPAGKEVEVAFTTEDHSELLIESPELWWPNGYGEATLHDLVVTAEVGGRVSDRRTTRVGLRQIDYDYEKALPFPAGSSRVEQTQVFDRQEARHVRLSLGRRATGWGFSIFDLEVRDGERGDDLALHRTATASSVDGGGPESVTDGDHGTRWSSAYQDDQWIAVDLGETRSFDRIMVAWETAYATDYVIQVSADGESWTDVQSVSNAGRPLTISVNGVRVFARGGNWGFDELIRRMPEERLDAVMAMHRDMNFTMIRNWLGSSNREEFFAKCDEYGLLVWNDFWNAWGMNPPDHPSYLATARDTMRRYRSHASIAVWCGANEGNPPQEIDEGVLQIAQDEDPNRLYVPNSYGGIVGGGGPYYRVEPSSYFDEGQRKGGVFGFHTEIGMPSVPVAESMRNLVGDQPEWPIGGAWYYHDWSTKGNQGVDSYKDAIDQRLGASVDLDQFASRAQFVNYENFRAMFEAWNSRLWDDASGLLLWMSHPAWHSTVWQTYDYDLDVNGTYYGVRKACEPLHVQADPTTWTVRALNHTVDAVEGATVTARLVGLDGTGIGKAQSAALDLPASSGKAAFDAAWPAGVGAHLLVLELADRRGRQLSTNTYLRYQAAADAQVVMALPAARTELRAAKKVRTERGVQTATVSLRNRSAVPGAMVRVSVWQGDERLLPTTYSDNYVWLLGGDDMDVTVSWPESARGSGHVTVRIEGYNVPRQEVRIG